MTISSTISGPRRSPLTAIVLLALLTAAAGASAQVPPSSLRSIDVYRTAQLEAEALVARHSPALRELVAAISANDEAAAEGVRAQIIESISASGDFAYVDINVTATAENSETVLDVSIEVVDAADAPARLAFDPEPTGSVADPGGVLAAWSEYEKTVLELVQLRLIEPTILFAECPAHHCLLGFDHEALAPFLERFDRAARVHRGELVRVLREDAAPHKRAHAAFVLAHAEDVLQLVRDLVPSLDDAAPGVRNNVMRVLVQVAMTHPDVDIPVEPLGRRLDDPSSACRNKAASVIAALATRPEYRDEILALAPAVLRLLRLQKPNNHRPAYQTLTAISGADFDARDYDLWEAWVERNGQ